jgi:hypothetical protein
MSASAPLPVSQPDRFGRLWWLPAGGRGNGLDDAGWAPIADVDAALVDPLFRAFRVAGVAAYAAPLPRSAHSPRRRALMPSGRFRVWVGTSAYGRAEEVLLVTLAALKGRRAQ